MPIGKNSLKRVGNNGYSNVKTTAPDMENSEIIEEAKAPKSEKAAAPKKAPAKKPAAEKASASGAKKPASKKASSAVKKPAVKVTEAPESKENNETKTSEASVGGNERIEVGMQMPAYLL